MNVVTLTDDNFESEVNASEKPVLVDYWATWCGPCKMVSPIVEEIAIEFSDQLKVGKLDVDNNQASAAQQNVMSIPTLAIFKGGELVAQQVGALSKTQLTEFIESLSTQQFEKVTNLDFRKLYKRGFSADSVTGKFRITDKSLQIKEPVLLKSGSSQFIWTGDISRDQKGNLDRLNLEVIMTLPLREYLPAYALVLGGPITAGVVYIAGKAFEKNLDKISSGKWKIKGDISNPKTDFDGWFENNDPKD